MPDEQNESPAKLPIPRPVEKRKPAKVRKLQSPEQENLAEIEKAAAKLSQLELACAIIATEQSEEVAAQNLGIDLVAVKDILRRKPVIWYLEQVQQRTIEKLAQAKVRLFRKVGVTQANVEQRLMDLAQMDPSETKGSIEGQVKALRTLAEILGMLNPDDPLKGKSRQELEAFVQKAAERMPTRAASGLLPPEVSDRTPDEQQY